MKDNKITYESAGVNLLASEKIKGRIKDLADKTYTSNVLGGVGGFGAMYKISGVAIDCIFLLYSMYS